MIKNFSLFGLIQKDMNMMTNKEINTKVNLIIRNLCIKHQKVNNLINLESLLAIWPILKMRNLNLLMQKYQMLQVFLQEELFYEIYLILRKV